MMLNATQDQRVRYMQEEGAERCRRAPPTGTDVHIHCAIEYAIDEPTALTPRQRDCCVHGSAGPRRRVHGSARANARFARLAMRNPTTIRGEGRRAGLCPSSGLSPTNQIKEP